MKVQDIRKEFINSFHNNNFVKDKLGGNVIEIVGVSFLADEDYIFGKPNKDYIEREIEWYNSKSLYVKDIPGKTPDIWKAVSSTEGMINSNYGWCLFDESNFSQYANCLETLKKDINSRRAIMIYTRPRMQEDYNRNGMSDFMCTNTVQYMIRDNKLTAIVNMRSNDVVFGYRNDYAWQNYIIQKLSKDLFNHYKTKFETEIIWQVGSLHIYERNFKLIEKYIHEKF